MGLISARFLQAPLMISVAKLSEKKLKNASPTAKNDRLGQMNFQNLLYFVDFQ